MAGRGRPPHEPTEKDRELVRLWAADGRPIDDIAEGIGISPNTLVKHYREELDEAEDLLIAKVKGFLFKNCEEGNVTAQIFFLKVRAGWSEKMKLEHSGGITHSLDLTKLSTKEVDALEQIVRKGTADAPAD